MAYYYKEQHDGQYELAIADYNKAVEINPQDETAYFNRGLAHHRKGQFDLAIADYTKAIGINPRYAKAYYDRGNVYRKNGQYDLAIADYTKAIEITPQNGDAYFYRGWAYYRSGQYDLAIADYTKAIEVNPQFAEAYSQRGWVYLFKNDGNKAFADAAKSLELRGLDNYERYTIIVGYLGLRKSGKTADANKFLEKWFKAAKQDAWTTQILEYFSGQLTSEQLLALAVDNDKLTEAHTYIGEMQLLGNNSTNAVRHFNWVKENGNKTFFEYVLSITELERLK